MCRLNNVVLEVELTLSMPHSTAVAVVVESVVVDLVATTVLGTIVLDTYVVAIEDVVVNVYVVWERVVNKVTPQVSMHTYASVVVVVDEVVVDLDVGTAERVTTSV